MRTTFGIPVLLFLTAVAGCVEPASPGETSDTTTRATTTSTATNSTTHATNTTTTMPNEPPKANLTHDLDNDTVAVNTTFNFTVDGDDQDGDNLTWDLDVDGDNESDYNGTDADFGEVSHNYTENGTFNATLTVSDAQDNATSSVLINVTASAGGAKFQDSVLLPCTTCPDVFIDSVEFELTPDLVGLPFLAESTQGDPDLIFTSEDCDGDEIELVADEGPETGTVPEGAACMIVWEFLFPDSEITVTIGTPPPDEEEP
ncbi:MAG TPA: PKD domain-containing protein [Candidatus Thermoplasmatota archaeon]